MWHRDAQRSSSERSVVFGLAPITLTTPTKQVVEVGEASVTAEAKDGDDKWDTEGMVFDEYYMQGWINGSDADKALYTAFISIGTLLLVLSYPLTFLNERKYLNLNVVSSKIEEELYRADQN